MARNQGNRWQGRPYLAAVFRAFLFAAPIAAAAATSSIVAHIVNRSPGAGSLPLRWSIVIASSLLVLVVVDRLFRGLFPLAVLLRLALAFPGRCPSRLSVALAAANLKKLDIGMKSI